MPGKLTFSHYCEVMDLDDDEKRSFYEREAANSGWSVRELRRQMDSMLFERVLSAKGDANKTGSCHICASWRTSLTRQPEAGIIITDSKTFGFCMGRSCWDWP